MMTEYSLRSRNDVWGALFKIIGIVLLLYAAYWCRGKFPDKCVAAGGVPYRSLCLSPNFVIEVKQ
jgi:hypothetical protein